MTVIDIRRQGVRVGACTTLTAKSLELGGSYALLRMHKQRATEGFPSVVAKFGHIELYVSDELDAFYQSVMWRQADESIRELTGEL